MRGLVSIFPCEQGFVAWYKNPETEDSGGTMAGFAQRPIVMWGLFAALLQDGAQDTVVAPLVRDYDETTIAKAGDLPHYLGFTTPGEDGAWFMARHEWREGHEPRRALRLMTGPGGRDGPARR